MSNTSDENSTSRAIKVSLPLNPLIHDALKREAKLKQRELTEHIQRVLAEHVIEAKAIEQAEADRLRLFWSIVERTVEAAQGICRDGGFSSAITLNSIKTCMKDPKWVSDYQKYVQDDIFKHGNPHKGPINREIGWRIRAGIGGKIMTDAKGKVATQKVLGEIIQSYTPMESFDPDEVQAKSGFPLG